MARNGQNLANLNRINALILLIKIVLLLHFFTCQISLAILPAQAQAQQRSGTIAQNARLIGNTSRTRFILDFSREVLYRTFTLPDPYRLVIDLPDVEFRMPTNAGKQSLGLVSAFRYGLFAPGKARIVIDVNQPFKIENSFVVKPLNGQPARLVLDLTPTDRHTFSKLQSLQKQQFAKERQRTGFPTASLPKLAIKPKKAHRTKKRPLIVIDPGHGGIDTGAIGVKGVEEKSVVLAFSKLLRKELQNLKRFRVALTRNTDVFISLKDRVAMARRAEADLFVSVHADSAPNRYRFARGATFYTLSEKASDIEARELAQRENRSDIIAGLELPPKSDRLSDILIDLVQRETKNHSIAFSHLLVNNLKGKIRLKTEPVRFANFRVLKAPDVPSVLIELGYLTSAQDEKLIKSPQWQKKVSKSVAKAVDNYFSQRVAGVPY